MQKSGSNPRAALVDMASCIKAVAKEYTRDVRKKAWKKLVSPDGKREIEKILNQTSRPVSRFRSLTFGEWLNEEEKMPAQLVITGKYYILRDDPHNGQAVNHEGIKRLLTDIMQKHGVSGRIDAMQHRQNNKGATYELMGSISFDADFDANAARTYFRAKNKNQSTYKIDMQSPPEAKKVWDAAYNMAWELGLLTNLKILTSGDLSIEYEGQKSANASHSFRTKLMTWDFGKRDGGGGWDNDDGPDRRPSPPSPPGMKLPDTSPKIAV